MDPRQRIVLLVVAAVVLVGGILLAATSGDDGESGSTETTAAPAREEPSGGDTTTSGEKPKARPEPRVDTIRIRGGRPVGGEKELAYERGDTIALRFVSDAKGEVHIHGFDTYVDVGPDPKVTRFEANLEGIFEVEEHGSGEILAKLEISPK